MSKIKRNDPCSCGSGKKYKNCCSNKNKNKASFFPLFDKLYDFFLKGDQEFKETSELNRRPGSSILFSGGGKGINISAISPEAGAFLKALFCIVFIFSIILFGAAFILKYLITYMAHVS